MRPSPPTQRPLAALAVGIAALLALPLLQRPEDMVRRGGPAVPQGTPAGNNHPFVITSGASGGVCWVDVWLRIDPGLTELYLVKDGVRTDLMTGLEPVPQVAVVAGGAAPTAVSLPNPVTLGIHDGFAVRWTGQQVDAPHFIDADHVGLLLRAGGSKVGARFRRRWANPPMGGKTVTFGFSYLLSPAGVERTVERQVDSSACGGDETTPPASVTPPTPATATDTPTQPTPPGPTDTPTQPTPPGPTDTPTQPTPPGPTDTPTPPATRQRIYVPKPFLPVPVTRKVYVPKPFLPQPVTRKLYVPKPFLSQR